MFVFFNQNQLNMKKLLAELIGTFSLVFFGCGAAVVSGVSAAGPDGIGLLGISFAFGLTVVAMAYAIGGITGCHINPAITISMLVAGKIKTGEAINYIIGQLIGATLAAGVLSWWLQHDICFSSGSGADFFIPLCNFCYYF